MTTSRIQGSSGTQATQLPVTSEPKKEETIKKAPPTENGAKPSTDATATKAERSIAEQAQSAELQKQLDAKSTEKSNASADSAAVLKQGSKGPEVEDLQKKLNVWREEQKLPAIQTDGKYGPETTNAVHDYQKATGLKPGFNAGPDVQDRLKLGQDPNFKKLSPDAQKHVSSQLSKMEKNPEGRKALKDIATDPELAKLPPSAQENAVKAFGKNPTEDQGILLKDIYSKPEFQKLDDVSKNKMMELAAAKGQNPEFMVQLRDLSQNGKFQALNPAEREKTLNVFGASEPNSREALMKLLNKDINGKSALLDKASDGSTALDNLDRLAKSNLDPRLTSGGRPESKAKVLESLMNEMAEPAKTINQGDRGTCTVTSMSHGVADKNPAEYSRLVTDLATKGESKLKNGDTIKPPADAYIEDHGGRSPSERLLQSSLMNYARPGEGYQNWNPGKDGKRGTPDDGYADPTNPSSKSLDGYPPNGGGLTYDDNMKVLKGLHGKDYERHTDDLLDRTKKQIEAGKGPVFTGVEWDGGMHAVEITKIENGRVYYRNPWGPDGVGPTDGPDVNGLDRKPPRRVEDGPNGVESMRVEDYNKLAKDIIVQK